MVFKPLQTYDTADDYRSARFWSSSRCFCVADFVRAAQGFCVVGLLTYAVSLVILVAYLAVPFLQETRGVLIALCLLTFSAGGYGTVAMTWLLPCACSPFWQVGTGLLQ